MRQIDHLQGSYQDARSTKHKITTTRCVITQKVSVLSYLAAEALNHVHYTSRGGHCTLRPEIRKNIWILDP